MTTTTYDFDRTRKLRKERENVLAKMRGIVSNAKSAGRDLDRTEQDVLNTGSARVKDLDAELKEQSSAMVKAVINSGSCEDFDDGEDRVRYLSLRRPGVKADLATRFGAELGSPAMKALVDTTEPYTTIPMDPEPFRMEQAPTSLLEVLPSIKRPVVYRYMKQTTRQNNAAPVPAGGLKPTSSFGLAPVEGRLKVIAHVSEPLDKYTLSDGPSLTSFVQLEMVDGLHEAVEAQLLGGDGTGENLTGLAMTSGIQTQALVTNPILTARTAITKVEVLGYTPSWFVINPLDWQAIETTQLTAGQYVLNAEGSRSGVPVDMAARRLWGVPVSVTTGVPAGSGYLLSSGVAQVATDGQLATEWSHATGDDFSRNQVRLRVEGRFDLAVTRPLGVVKMNLS